MALGQQYIHMSRYSRWRDDLGDHGRREVWTETLYRYINFFQRHLEKNYPVAAEYFEENKLWAEIYNAMDAHEVMPSMRAMMTAGHALDRDNVAGFNCAYIAVDHVRVFDEILYILSCGTGVGFSVERQYINQLPIIGAYIKTDDGQATVSCVDEFVNDPTVLVVRDSKIGWAEAYRQLIKLLYEGRIPTWDTTKVRPAGSRLKTFGGRASGPQPLIDLFEFTIAKFRGALGRKLNSIEVHDIVCKIADVIVVGGVRRSALISLSNLSDDRMRNAKNGDWRVTQGHRQLANNSVAYTEKPDLEIFLKEWNTLYESRAGERGIFNRVAAKRKMRENGRRNANQEVGCNPCAEILLPSASFCNLTESVCRVNDTLATMRRKVRLATILGTLQATLTNFRYLRPIWRQNCERERLLGVSLTGIMDSPLMRDLKKTPQVLQELKQLAIDTNKEFASLLGITQSVAVTCVKPSGTVSQLVNSSSGIHPGYSQYYIRRYRSDRKDLLCQFLIEAGIPWQPAIGKEDSVAVFEFPMEAAPHSITADKIDAMHQLQLYKMYLDNWAEHNVSNTVYYRDDDFLEVGAWIYKNFDHVCGVSLLPYDGGIYKQAPYQPITKEQYEELVACMPKINWLDLQRYEKDDQTSGSREIACSGGTCEFVGTV
jgi:ribonucleoside-diphosphate reductase alpha chain